MNNGESRLAEGKGLLLVQLLLNSSWSLKEQRRERERGDGGNGFIVGIITRDYSS